jgi:periplasmic divalent cation tolerance protein
MIEDNEFRIVYVTINSIEKASHVSRIIVSENLAACCTVLPNAVSFFSWENVINERHECLIMIKTNQILINELFKRICELHNDEIPEMISVKIEDAHQPYLDWMKSTLK